MAVCCIECGRRISSGEEILFCDACMAKIDNDFQIKSEGDEMIFEDNFSHGALFLKKSCI